jgi:pimeloyl-ACP methyl ester carboxylesterase
MNRASGTKGNKVSDLEQATIKHRPTPVPLRSTVTSRDGAPIAFTRAGEGRPLVLIDGAFCHRGMGPSSPLAALLARSYTVFTYDRRGRGESGDNPPYAVERELEDLETLIEEASGSAYVWGISSGAVLALEAARRGVGIAKLALYEPPLIVDDSRPPIPADIASQLNDLVAADRRNDAVRLFLRQMGAPRIVIALMRRLPVWPKLCRVAHTLPYDMTIVSPYQRGTALPTNRWEDMAVPTLVMVGGKSPAWLHHSGQALADVLPTASHRVVEGQTHNVKAKSSNVSWRRFVRRHGSGWRPRSIGLCASAARSLPV